MSRLVRTLGGLAVALAVLAPSPAAAAPSDEDAYVRDVAGRAAAHVEQERYEQALAVLDEAERDRPHPVFIYVRATIEERRGDCERAAELYRQFLSHDVPEADAEEARRGEARCRETSAEPTPGEPTPGEPGAKGAESSSEPPVTDDPTPRRWIADPLGGILAAGGVVGVGVGLGLIGGSRADARAASEATSLQSYEERSNRAVTLNRAGIATVAVGSALLVAGVARYAWVASRGRRTLSFGPRWIPRGLAASAVVRF